MTVAPGISPVRLLAIGCSTGGPAALHELLRHLPPDLELPILIAQHFTIGAEDGLARWLSSAGTVRIEVLRGSANLVPGLGYLAPADLDIQVESPGRAGVKPGIERGYHPRVDVLFASAAAHTRGGLLAVVLSGVGKDGLEGAQAVLRNGGVLLAQDDVTSAAYGMPGAVTEAGYVSAWGAPAVLARVIGQLTARRRLGMRDPV